MYQFQMKSSVVPLSTAKKVSDVFVTTPKMPTKTRKPKSLKIRAKREIFFIAWKVKLNLDTPTTTTTTQPTSTTTVSSSNENEEEETEVQGETTGTTGWILQNSLNSRFCICTKN